MARFVPKHFAQSLDAFAKEILPSEVYTRYGEKGLRMLDQRILEFTDEFRYDVGYPLEINTPWNGIFDQSGLRSHKHYNNSYEDLFWSLSDHTFGRGEDIKCSKLTGNELRCKFIEKEKYYYEKYDINFVEVGDVKKDGKWVGMSWAHFSTRLDTSGKVEYWSPRWGFVSKERVLGDKL